MLLTRILGWVHAFQMAYRQYTIPYSKAFFQDICCMFDQGAGEIPIDPNTNEQPNQKHSPLPLVINGSDVQTTMDMCIVDHRQLIILYHETRID